MLERNTSSLAVLRMLVRFWLEPEQSMPSEAIAPTVNCGTVSEIALVIDSFVLGSSSSRRILPQQRLAWLLAMLGDLFRRRRAPGRIRMVPGTEAGCPLLNDIVHAK
jgi:hypothetical protein